MNPDGTPKAVNLSDLQQLIQATTAWIKAGVPIVAGWIALFRGEPVPPLARP